MATALCLTHHPISVKLFMNFTARDVKSSQAHILTLLPPEAICLVHILNITVELPHLSGPHLSRYLDYSVSWMHVGEPTDIYIDSDPLNQIFSYLDNRLGNRFTDK